MELARILGKPFSKFPKIQEKEYSILLFTLSCYLHDPLRMNWLIKCVEMQNYLSVLNPESLQT